MAKASCVYPGQEAAVAAAQQGASTEPVVVEINTCGGDDTSYQVPLSVDVTFDGRTFNSVYATTNSVITFGAPDGTYWDYPQTPSISLYSFDWVVYPGARGDEHLIIRSSDGGFQVDISARPIWLQNATDPTNIVITAAILSDGTVAMAYTLSGPEYPEYSPRTGVRLNDGTIETFEEYGIQETEETPELAPEPTEEAPFTPEPEPEPTPEPAPSLNAPTNVTATQSQDGTVQLTWDTPTATSTSVERYAVFFSTDNFNTGWAVSSTTNSINISREVFETSGGLDQTYQFRIRSDNDTVSVYSSFSETASTLVSSPPPPAPTIPDGAEVVNEGSTFQVVAPVGQRIANAVGYYGDPNDSTRGGEVSSILFELLAGETSATVEVTNETFANDPAPGTVKILIILITYEDIPVAPQPSPGENAGSESQPSTPIAPEPEPSLEPEPEAVTPPQPEEIEQPEEPTTEPEEPVEEPSLIEPEPSEPPIIEPEEESITSAEELPEDLSVDQLLEIDLEDIVATELSEEQAEALKEAALVIFETAEKGSEEYQQALEALLVAAQQDDIVLNEELLAIPLLGDALGGAVELVNLFGNAGADMSPQTRETSEEVIVAAVIVGQVALLATSNATMVVTMNARQP